MRVADCIAKHISSFGVEKSFGIPGGEVLTLLDAFRQYSIDFHLVKHENSGGYMGMATYQRTGKPAVLIATLGPGVSNAANVLASCLQDRIPLIFLSGALDGTDKAGYQHQIIDHVAMFKPICKYSGVLEHCETENDVAIQIDKLMHIALEGRKGPVHLDIPVKLAAKEVLASPRLRIRKRHDQQNRTLPLQDASFAETQSWIKKAERPLIVLGNDILCEGSAMEIRSTVAALNIPVLSSYQAKGVIPESSPLSVGCFCLSPLADEILLPFVQKADVVILVGFDPIESRISWQDAWHPEHQKVISLSLEPNFHYHHFETKSYICHLASGLSLLQEGLQIRTTDIWQGGEPSEVRTTLRKIYGQQHDWGMGAIVQTVQHTLPENTVLSLDTGAHRIVASQVWQAEKPQTILQSQGFGSMACGLPLAIGVSLADGKDTTSCTITGDAGFLMCVGELASLRDWGLKVILIVIVDNSLALIEVKQHRMQLAHHGVDFQGGYDYVKIAEAFGGKGFSVFCKEELINALEIAKESEEFSILACHLDPNNYKAIL